jgi:predicted SnoaL-like aldol condensation-catalyzing enzyme
MEITMTEIKFEKRLSRKMKPGRNNKTFGWAVMALLISLIGSAPLLAETPSQLEANKKIVIDFYLNGLQSRNMSVASGYLSDGYIQHNPTVPTGKAGFIKAFASRWASLPPNAPAPTINPPVLVMAENDLVTLVFKRNEPEPGQPGKTYEAFWFDTFRVDHGKITEHWDPALKPAVSPATK